MFTKSEFERACELMHAQPLTDFEEDEQLAIAIKVGKQEYHLAFRLPGDISMLNPSTPPLTGGFEFMFKCNSVTFHPASTPANYMICFLQIDGRLKTPKVLIAGGDDGVRRLLMYSTLGVETDDEIEFPRQL